MIAYSNLLNARKSCGMSSNLVEEGLLTDTEAILKQNPIPYSIQTAPVNHTTRRLVLSTCIMHLELQGWPRAQDAVTCNCMSGMRWTL